jgi:UDP-N-acetylmuramyl pentapeptide synthase
MNEMGESSRELHENVAKELSKSKIDILMTVGEWAKLYTADFGGEWFSFDNPYDAGEKLKEIVEAGDVVCGKGSQNRIFVEESLKYILPSSEHKNLVRQSDAWLAKKRACFK